MQEPLRDGGPAGPEPADPADGRGRGPAGKGKLPAVRGRTRGGRPRDPRRLVADRGGPLAGAADQARLNFNLKFNLRAAAGKPRASPVPSWAGAGPGAGATNPAADPAVQVSRARRGRPATFRGLPAEKSAGVRVPRPAGAPACAKRRARRLSVAIGLSYATLGPPRGGERVQIDARDAENSAFSVRWLNATSSSLVPPSPLASTEPCDLLWQDHDLNERP